MSTCPSCAGPRLERHPLGLVFHHQQSCPLLAAEDATRVADVDRIGTRSRFERPSTTTERLLLAAAGAAVDDDALTCVARVTGSRLGRSWKNTTLDPES